MPWRRTVRLTAKVRGTEYVLELPLATEEDTDAPSFSNRIGPRIQFLEARATDRRRPTTSTYRGYADWLIDDDRPERFRRAS